MNIPPVSNASYMMFVLMAMLLGPAFYFIWRAKRGAQIRIRRIPGIDAIEEGIGRATEMGRPMAFSTGLTGVSPLLYAVLGIIEYVARQAALLNTKLLLPQNDYEVMPIVEDRVREAYRAEGRLDLFDPEDIRFLSTDQFAFASGYMGIVHREQAASCFLFGFFAAESLILAQAGQQIGALQVAGTPSNEQIPFFLTTCDYTLIGEEVYAAGAYLSGDPNQLGGLKGQDYAKLAIILLVVLGLLVSLGLTAQRGNSKEGEMFNSPYARAYYVKPEWERCIARIDARVDFNPEVYKKDPKVEPKTLVGNIAAWAAWQLAQPGADREGIEPIGREAGALRDRLAAGAGDKKLAAEADALAGRAARVYYRQVRARMAQLKSEATAGRYPAGSGAIRFDGKRSVDGNGDPLAYAWTIDGEKKTGSVAKHEFKSPGTYGVKLAVTDAPAEKDVDLAGKGVIHQTVKAGTKVQIRRLPIREAVPGTVRFCWTFGEEPPVENREFSRTRTLDSVGTRRVRVEIDYIRKDAKAGDPPGKLVYTVYLHVVEAHEHSAGMTLTVTQALPEIRPPWTGRPKAQPAKVPEPAGGGGGGQ